jgi:hypothetical protein
MNKTRIVPRKKYFQETSISNCNYYIKSNIFQMKKKSVLGKKIPIG